MVRISEDMLRKRAEHNNLEITTLEEVSLHQQDIERIEYIDKWCRDLRILYLQSNLIPKIENVGRLKKLEYINLALNNIEKIENLEGCESLKKLDLTVNFVGELTSIECLRDNYNLREIFLTGNPCVNFEGYREYVIATLPQLQYLDGQKITKTERILALQHIDSIKPQILQDQAEYLKKREKEKAEAEEEVRRREAKSKAQSEKKPGFDGRWYTDINAEDSKKQENKESEEEQIKENEDETKKDDEFWEEEMPFSPESRVAVHKHIQETKNKESEKKDGPQVAKRTVRLTTEDGNFLNVNEAKMPFTLLDNEEDNAFTLEVGCYKYLNTSLIDVDVQPSHVKVVIKGKILQIVLQEEVNPDSSVAKRSQTTGHLLITMPKVKQVVKALKKPSTQSKKKTADTKQKETSNNERIRHEKLEVDPSKAKSVDLMVTNEKTPLGPYEGSRRKKVEERPNSEDFVDDPDVPPLI